jgi:hypothetical protein
LSSGASAVCRSKTRRSERRANPSDPAIDLRCREAGLLTDRRYGHLGEVVRKGPEILGQACQSPLRIQAEFKDGPEILRWFVPSVRAFGFLQRLKLPPALLPGREHARVVAHNAAHKPLPITARAVEPRQPPDTIECQILPEVFPFIRREAEARLQEARPQRGLLKQVWGKICQG